MTQGYILKTTQYLGFYPSLVCMVQWTSSGKVAGFYPSLVCMVQWTSSDKFAGFYPSLIFISYLYDLSYFTIFYKCILYIYRVLCVSVMIPYAIIMILPADEGSS